jgi:hypothetical protein
MRLILLASIAALFLSGIAHAQDTIGRTVVVVEKVDGTLQQTVRRLGIRDDVFQNEIIDTDVNSASEIVFVDGTSLALGPTSKVTLSNLVYDPRPSRQKLSINASQGVFRFVTGAFSKEAYEIQTPTATIGVRGTVAECWTNQDGTFCRVIEGRVILTDRQTGQVQEIVAGQSGMVGNVDAAARAGELDLFRSMLRNARYADAGFPFGRAFADNGPLPFLGSIYVPSTTTALTAGSTGGSSAGGGGSTGIASPPPAAPVSQTIETSAAEVASPSGF